MAVEYVKVPIDPVSSSSEIHWRKKEIQKTTQDPLSTNAHRAYMFDRDCATQPGALGSCTVVFPSDGGRLFAHRILLLECTVHAVPRACRTPIIVAPLESAEVQKKASLQAACARLIERLGRGRELGAARHERHCRARSASHRYARVSPSQ